jgi:hypothetical protein
MFRSGSTLYTIFKAHSFAHFSTTARADFDGSLSVTTTEKVNALLLFCLAMSRSNRSSRAGRLQVQMQMVIWGIGGERGVRCQVSGIGKQKAESTNLKSEMLTS